MNINNELYIVLSNAHEQACVHMPFFPGHYATNSSYAQGHIPLCFHKASSMLKKSPITLIKLIIKHLLM